MQMVLRVKKYCLLFSTGFRLCLFTTYEKVILSAANLHGNAIRPLFEKFSCFLFHNIVLKQAKTID